MALSGKRGALSLVGVTVQAWVLVPF